MMVLNLGFIKNITQTIESYTEFNKFNLYKQIEPILP